MVKSSAIAKDVDRLTIFAHQRPKTRADCLPGGCNEERPCPWVGCRHHLGLEICVDAMGHPTVVRLTWGDETELDFSHATCSLDVAESGPHLLSEVGSTLNLKHERIRQIEVEALRVVKRRLKHILLE